MRYLMEDNSSDRTIEIVKETNKEGATIVSAWCKGQGVSPILLIMNIKWFSDNIKIDLLTEMIRWRDVK